MRSGSLRLRNQSADAERLLWRHLRRRQLGGFRFRRQMPVGRYVADFACMNAKLVIELDGGQHQEQATRDARRDARINLKGYRVVRFWNNQVFEDTTAVLEVNLNELLALRPILSFCSAPSVPLPRKRRKEPSDMAAGRYAFPPLCE